MTVWRPIAAEESTVIRAVLAGNNISEVHDLPHQLDGALVSHTTPWILDIKVSARVTAVDLPDGPFPARAFVPNRAAYQGEIIVWIAEGRLAGLEYAWVSDESPTRWPEPREMEIAPHHWYRAMIDYTALPDLSGVYLEDSYVLEICEHADVLVFRLDAVLTPDHAAYLPPRPGEQYCYAFGDLVFRDVVRVDWVSKSACRFTDATGETDLGNIDSLKFDGSVYALQGDWGGVRIESAPPRFELRDSNAQEQGRRGWI